MSVILTPGQSARRPAEAAQVRWRATGRPGHVRLEATGDPAPPGEAVGAPAAVRVPAPDVLVVRDLAGPLVVTAVPAAPDVFFADGTTVTLALTLTAAGRREELLVQGIDLGGGTAAPLLRLAPAGEGAWDVSVAEQADDVVLPARAMAAYYAARRVPVAAPLAGPLPLVAVDLSASMAGPLRDGLVQGVLDAVCGAAVRCFGPRASLGLVGYGDAVRRAPEPLAPGVVDGLVARLLLEPAPTSGAYLSGVLGAARRDRTHRVVAVCDGVPADLDDLLALLAGRDVALVLVVLAESGWAADPEDRTAGPDAWRDELGALGAAVGDGLLHVVSVPAAGPLTEARVQALAAALTKALAA